MAWHRGESHAIHSELDDLRGKLAGEDPMRETPGVCFERSPSGSPQWLRTRTVNA